MNKKEKTEYSGENRMNALAQALSLERMLPEKWRDQYNTTE